MMRGSAESDVIEPALLLHALPLGWPKTGWLAKLKTSQRI
jgi:hypothetical protein